MIVAEGARDRHGNPITAEDVRKALRVRLNEDVRVTILGHVQRGGAPSAFDRNMGTLLGHAAVEELLSSPPGSEPQLIGMKDNRVTHQPLAACVERTRLVGERVACGDYKGALELRGAGFDSALRTLRTLVQALPHPPAQGQKRFRFAIMHGGGPAPGMNTAVRAAVRLLLDRGHHVLGVRNAFKGLIEGDVFEMGWMSVNGWASRGGAELGTNRREPADRELYQIARHVEEQKLDGILMIGGWSGYAAVAKLVAERARFPAFDLPIVCLPATIDNNLPGSELSVGSDTALNNIVGAVDKIKTTAVASQRCFVVEVMGRRCGYLALLSGLATGAERVYMHEDGVTLADLQRDLASLRQDFQHGQAARADDPQRGSEPVLHHALHLRAVRTGRRRALRRAPGDPRPPAAGRRPEPVRPHPGDAARRDERRVPGRARSAGALRRRGLRRHPRGQAQGHAVRRGLHTDGPREPAAARAVVASARVDRGAAGGLAPRGAGEPRLAAGWRTVARQPLEHEAVEADEQLLAVRVGTRAIARARDALAARAR